MESGQLFFSASSIEIHRRFLAAAGLGLVLTLLLCADFRVAAQSPVPHDVVFLIDNSQSVSTGEGSPDNRPTDPAQTRLRLAHFVINVLRTSPPGVNRRVGVIGFAGSAGTLMPLTPVLDWSKADFAEIRAARQAGGTDFARALDAASDMLAADCSPDVRRCDVVMITDGVFERYTARRDQRATQNVLQNLRSRGISVHVLTFEAGDPQWQEFLADDLISTCQPDVTSIPPDQVYDAVLHDLGLGTLLAGLTPVEVAGEEIVTLTIHEFRTWTRYQILPDSPLTVTFFYQDQVVTPVVVGTEYTLFQPQAGEWDVRLEGNGLAYYQQTGEGVADLALRLRTPQGVLPLGEDVTVRAELLAGGRPVSDLALFTVAATISDAMGSVAAQTLKPDETIDLFAATVPADRFENGAYTVTLAVQSSVPGLRGRPATGQFEMVALPTLTMVVTPTETVRPGQSVHVIVTVENWRPEYVPRLQIYGPDAIRVATPTWGSQRMGVFTSTITTPFGGESSFAVAAQLVGDSQTTVGELFDTIQTAPQLVEYTPAAPEVTPIQRQVWLLIPLCVMLAIGTYAWGRFHNASKHRQRARRIKRLRAEVEALARMVGEIPEDDGTIVESWHV